MTTRPTTPAGPSSPAHPHSSPALTPAGRPHILRHGPRTERVVALTFDDGWDPDACESIARTLRATGAVATFFVNGMRLQLDPGRWRDILGDFPVANHTRSHRWLTRIGSESAARQIRTNERIHEDILGRPMLKMLRPPYGTYDESVLEVAMDLGYRDIILWDTSSADTSTAATVRSVVRNATRGKNGSIVLMHCGPPVTPRALPAIIRDYRARGFRLVGLDELFER